MDENRANSGMDMASWSKLAHLGSANAITGLSQMVNQDISINTLGLEEVSLRNAVSLLGKPDDLGVSVYLSFTGGVTGQIMLAFQPETAFELVDMAMGLPPGSTKQLDEMERSVLGEIGNVVGTFFLNAVADHSNQRLMPSPPAVTMDMSGALVSSVMAQSFGSSESVFVIRMSFTASGRRIEGRFLVLPNYAAKASSVAGEE